MDKNIRACDPLRGVLPGQTATLDLPIGRRYHNLRFAATAKGAAGETIAFADLIDTITVKLNGVVQRTMTGTELNALNNLNSSALGLRTHNLTAQHAVTDALAATDTARFMFGIHFAEPFRKSYAATEALSWPTVWPDGTNVGTFQVEIAIPNTGHIDETAPFTILAWMETDAVLGPMSEDKKPIMNIVRWERFGVPYTASGEMPVTTLNRRDILLQSSIFSQSGDPITSVKVEVDDIIKRDVAKWQNDFGLIAREMNESALSADRYDIVFDASDLPTDGLILQGTNSFKITPNLSAANAANKMLTFVNQVYGRILA